MAIPKAGTTLDVFGVKMGYLNPTTLTPNPLNYQKHPDKQKAAISESIKEHGWVAFPIFNERTKRLIDGHARIEDAIKQGLEGVPVVIVDIPEKQEKRLLASFDRIGRMASVDEHLLAGLLRDIADDGPMPAGWTEDDLGDLLLKLDKEEGPALETAKKGATAGAGASVGGDEDDEDGTAGMPASQIRMVQLFLTTETEPEFKAFVTQLQQQWDFETLTDTVFEAVRLAAEGDRP